MSEILAPGVYVKESPSLVQAITGVSTSTPGFIGIVPDTIKLIARKKGESQQPTVEVDFTLGAPVGVPQLITNWTQFTKLFGDFIGQEAPESNSPPADNPTPTLNSGDNPQASTEGHRRLAHAVYGFFNNGGSRCYVARVASKDKLDDALKAFEAIDEISIVAAPGETDNDIYNKLKSHCEKMGNNCFAILDSRLDMSIEKPDISIKTNFAAVYFPWIKVFDPATKLLNPNGDGMLEVPPSGHIAGIYARVDYERGIYKAPANEAIIGARDVTKRLNKSEQGSLNDKGINCIREFNGNILVWGARTLSETKEYQYINVRRTLLYLRESIDKGTQWAIFEPNNPSLWQKITRNVSDFLLTAWRDGALFGNTPQEAFYVKCDAETNPPELREQGQVKAIVGVSIVRPAEFVIFNISQFTGTR